MTRPNLHYCPSCEDEFELNADGTCPLCDRVIDDIAAQEAEEALLSEYVFWDEEPRRLIVWDYTQGGVA